MKLIYVSGAYRSKRGVLGKHINIWRARRVAKKLWRQGYVAICPHLNTCLFPEDGINYIAGDCEIVSRCDGILMMKNWRKSEGAQIEMATAKVNGLEIYYEEDNMC